mgnify:CR=1 FL=1
MAAITGIIGNNIKPETINEMLKTMSHRGADSESLCGPLQAGDGEFCGGVTAPRLSAARGNGYAEKDGVVMLFDGEVYNDRAEGVSDAELALDLYRQKGTAFAGHLDGVFACAVYDKGRVLVARDAVGVRPVYVGTGEDGTVCFSSELKGLVGHATSIEELHPATVWSSDSGIAGYKAQVPDLPMPAEVEQAICELRKIVLESVERRIEDGACGACLLSGGLDSSIIAVAADHLGAKMPMITVGMEGAQDLPNAEIVAKHINAEHIVRNYEKDELAALVPAAVRSLESFDEDCVSGTLSNMFASACASEVTNCILSGEGGDELFGGYHLIKDIPSETGRLHMMNKLVAIAFNTALQRLDRAMMTNGITYRTPFLDSQVMTFAAQCPVRWKIFQADDGRWIEKWILREAFKDLLPVEIYKREKLRFAAGTGTDDIMDRIAEDVFDVASFNEDSRKTPCGYTLNSPKELWYYQIFQENFPGAAFEQLVGRWDPNK